MGSELRTALKQYFGHDAFREGQEQVIEALLAGRSSLAVFPTGGGKSLCYQLPALLMDGLTLVISPLIALMKDQVEALRAKNIPAARLDSTLSGDEVGQVLGDMRSGRLKLLYIAPERLMSESFMERLSRVKISLLAIDESHCISEWGHNFRPEYLRLAEVARKLQLHPVLALTATATPGVAEDIRRTFRIAPEDHIQTTFLRRNLAIQITPAPVKQRLALLTQKLQEERHFPAIVYVTLQQTAEEVATYLAKPGSMPGPIMLASRMTIATKCRTPSCPAVWTSLWPPSPSAWGSTRRTSAAFTTTICPRAWRTTSRRSDVPAAMARLALRDARLCR